MDLTQLRYFRAIAECGSLTAAAQQLHVSQPTLTISMRNLEEGLGTTLMLRDRTGIQLTSTGVEMLSYAAELFGVIERAEQRIRAIETENVGRFVLGCPESLAVYYLPGFLHRFHRSSPGIDVDLWNGSAKAVWQAVLSREVHFGLVANARPHNDLVAVRLFPEAFMPFMLADLIDPLINAERSAVGDLDGWHRAIGCLKAGPLIFPQDVPSCVEIVERLAGEGQLPTQMLACGSLELAKSLALDGLGVAILSQKSAAYGTHGRLTPLHPQLPRVTDIIYLVYRADLHRTRAALRLKDSLVAYGRELGEENSVNPTSDFTARQVTGVCQ